MDFIEDFETYYPWFFPIVSFALGAIVGSFLNVCIYRIPAKRSIVTPGSTCGCGKRIAWYDNIPILSWFVLRGRARCCNQSYSFRYPAVETLTGLLFLGCWIQQPPLKAICLMVFVSMLICGSFIDLDHMEIPDRFSIGLAFIGAVLSIGVHELHGIHESMFEIGAIKSLAISILGVFIGSAIILWIALAAEAILKKEAMGFGDVKLLGGIGAFIGWQGAIFSLFGGAVIGTIALAIIALWKTLGRRKGEKAERLLGLHTPFGPMLAAGAVAYALFFQQPVDAYFELIVKLAS